MKRPIITVHALAALSILMPAGALAALPCSLSSPDGRTLLTLTGRDGTLMYDIVRDGATLVEGSSFGIRTTEADFGSGVSCGDVTQRSVDDTFTMPALTGRTLTDRCSELLVPVTKDSRRMSLRIRLYNEGMAWRYELDGSGQTTVLDESGLCRIVGQTSAAALPLSRGGRRTFTEQSPALLGCLGRADLPLLPGVEGAGQLMLCETASDDWCGSALAVERDGAYRFVPREQLSVALPFATPWRMLVYGDSRQRLESSMAYALAPETALGDLSWIVPGRAVSAYSGQDHAASHLDAKTVRRYIDWAAEQGWQYFTLDRSWRKYNVDIKEIVKYASERRIGVFAWVSGSTLPKDLTGMRTLMSQLKGTGIKGIKVDFYEDCSLAANRSRRLMLQAAAEQQLMVMLGSQANAVGLARTWPHVVAVETGLTNASASQTPDLLSARHNIRAAIAHTASQPMDYTPVDLAESGGKLLQQVTHAHQLALALLFDAPVSHISDSPDNLRADIARDLLRGLPARWADSRILDVTDDSYLAVARTDGTDWYVGAVTDEARTASLPLDFLPEGQTVNAYIYRDGNCPSDLRFEYRTGLDRKSVLDIAMLRSGGAVVRLSASADGVKPFCAVYEAEAADNDNPFGTSTVEDPDSLCSGAAFVMGAGNGRNLTFRNVSVPKPGDYNLTVYYMASAPCRGFVRTNGSLLSLRSVDYIATGGCEGHSLARLSLPVTFDRSDNNTVELGASAALPAIDRITLTDNSTREWYSSLPQLPAAEPELAASVFGRPGGVGIEAEAGLAYSVTTPSGVTVASGTTLEGLTEVGLAVDGIVIVSLRSASNLFTKKLIINH